MKYDIGNKVRKYRRDADMTQAMLAEKFGVSEQAVSRWECGSAYPDVELIPMIARMFGVTIDQLFGSSDEERIRQAEEISVRLSDETWSPSPDAELIIGLLREIRRFHIDCNDHRWMWWCRSSVLADPEILPEARLAINAVLDNNHNYGEEVTRQNAVITLAKIEDDEHIDGLLKKYASYSDISRSSLLRCRYEHRGESEKLRSARQWRLFHIVSELMEDAFSPCSDDIGECLRDNDRLIEILRVFCDLNYDEAHPVRGLGKPCAWAEARINMGIKRAACLAALGDSDMAILILEETVSLIEDLMKIEPGTDVGTMSSCMGDVTLTSMVAWNRINDSEESRSVYFFAADPYADVTDRTDCISPELIVHKLTAPGINEWLDPIRGDKRYEECIRRIKTLAETRHV